jgi:hypothetical protein
MPSTGYRPDTVFFGPDLLQKLQIVASIRLNILNLTLRTLRYGLSRDSIAQTSQVHSVLYHVRIVLRVDEEHLVLYKIQTKLNVNAFPGLLPVELVALNNWRLLVLVRELEQILNRVALLYPDVLFIAWI